MQLEQIQSQTLATLRPLIGTDQRVALIDFPRHQNAGDSLIWLGTREYLERLGVRVGYVASLHHFSTEVFQRRVPDGPILISGGGSFGDRWGHSQEFRESVIAQFTHRKIIQLPQTMEFNTAEGLNRAQSIYGAHPDLTILIRDIAGTEKAKELFPRNNVAFCPDLALGYGRCRRSHPRHAVLYLKRTDNESVDNGYDLQSLGSSVRIADWGFRGPLRIPAWRALRLAEDVARIAPRFTPALYPIIEKSFALMAKANVWSARRILSSGNQVVTDRLHAMILAALLGIPVVAHDNANKKLSALFRDYVGRLDNVEFAEDAHTALRRVRT